MGKRKDAINQDNYIKKTPQPLKLILIILRYYTKELLFILLIIFIGLFVLFNVSYDKEHGLRIAPTIKAEIKKDL